METPAYIALSRQMVLRQQMDIIANNLANVNTSGYKSERMVFVEHLEETPDGKAISMVRDIAVARDLEQGPITLTGNDLDLAIRKDGYFAVETEAGIRYTRAGAFTLDEEGRIATFGGALLMGPGGTPISVPDDAEEIIVADDGTISTEDGEIGRIEIFSFENEQLLEKASGNLYDAGTADPQRVQEPEIEQGMVEGSNTKAVIEVSRMIETLRGYQATARMIEQEDRRQRQAIETLVAA